MSYLGQDQGLGNDMGEDAGLIDENVLHSRAQVLCGRDVQCMHVVGTLLHLQCC